MYSYIYIYIYTHIFYLLQNCCTYIDWHAVQLHVTEVINHRLFGTGLQDVM